MTIYEEWILEPFADSEPDLPVRFPITRNLLVRRGVRDRDSFDRYVNPTVDDLHDGTLIDGMGEACERIERAIRDGEPILIYGDYDVDGVTSIVLLRTVLRSLGAEVDHVVPHRLFDGYGLQTEVIDRVLIDRKVGLVITVDCGITAVEPVEDALEKGIDVIVTDHHLPPDVLPGAAAVLNPRKEGCRYPFKDLAGVGVAFKLCCTLLQRSGRAMKVESLAKIAAIGTVADVAPLVGENRTIARLGLRGLAESSNPGLRALLKSLGLYGSPLRGADVGFRIGPRINAAGRLASADSAIDLFEAKTEADAWSIVSELNRLNERRRTVERAILDDAVTRIGTEERPPVIFVAGEGWHRGVLGLCAGRLAERFQRPTLVASIDGDECIGSGRSVGSIDLHGRLERVREHFTRFGGHSFACGFSLPTRSLAAFRSALAEAFADVPASAYKRSTRVDGVVRARDLGRELLDEIELLEPFGEGNRQPRFALLSARVVGRREFSPGCHNLDLRDDSGGTSGVIWPSAESLVGMLDGSPVDLVFSIEPDRYMASGVRATILDLAPSASAPWRNESGERGVVPIDRGLGRPVPR